MEPHQPQGRLRGPFRDRRADREVRQGARQGTQSGAAAVHRHRGEQKDEATYESLKKSEAFVIRESATEKLTTSAHSAVKYDLIGKIAENTQLTRRTVAAILRASTSPFGQYKTNPEDFIPEAARSSTSRRRR